MWVATNKLLHNCVEKGGGGGGGGGGGESSPYHCSHAAAKKNACKLSHTSAANSAN